MSFLSVFKSILHAMEAASVIAAPIVAAQVDPTIGALMSQAATTAVLVEASIPATGSGATKALAVASQSQAIIDTISSILQSQGKAPLPANTNDLVQAGVKATVAGLNAVATAVAAAPAKP